MSRSGDDALAGLERIAGLKADLEMRRLAAFRTHVEAARHRISRLQAEFASLGRSDQPFSVAGARLTNALAGECSRALLAAEDELARMLPGYEAARQAALREFGRVQALRSLRRDLATQSRRPGRAGQGDG